VAHKNMAQAQGGVAQSQTGSMHGHDARRSSKACHSAGSCYLSWALQVDSAGNRWIHLDSAGNRCIMLHTAAYCWIPVHTSENDVNGCPAMNSLFLWWESTIESFGKEYIHWYAPMHWYPLVCSGMHLILSLSLIFSLSLILSLSFVFSGGKVL